MKETDGFYTLKGYSLQEKGEMTNAMEDYLEMISRLSPGGQADPGERPFKNAARQIPFRDQNGAAPGPGRIFTD